MPMEQETDYRREVQNASEKCQFIEDILRECIILAMDISRLQSSPHPSFNYKLEDIAKLPMGPLIRDFSKINTDAALHDDLKNLKRDRNDIAHKSFIFTLGELRDETHMSEATQKMKDIVTRATDIHHRVLTFRWDLTRSRSKLRRSAGKGHL